MKQSFGIASLEVFGPELFRDLNTKRAAVQRPAGGRWQLAGQLRQPTSP